MPPSHDLMERLAAADPLRDAEQLTADEQHEAEALLAGLLATPVSPKRRRAPVPRVRRLALGAVATACAALAALAAIDLIDSDAPGPNVVELAVAAVSAGDAVYHTVERTHFTGTGSMPDRRTVYVEAWHTTDGRVHHKLFAARGAKRGRLVSDFAGRRAPGRKFGPALGWEARSNTIYSMGFGTPRLAQDVPRLDPFEDPGAAIRELEAQGRLRLAGTANVDGRDAYRLVSGVVEGLGPGSEARVAFLVDAKTYLPLATRFKHRGPNGDTMDVFTRYLVYQRLPLDARTLAQLDLDPHPGAKCAPGAGKTRRSGTLGFRNPCAR